MTVNLPWQTSPPSLRNTATSCLRYHQTSQQKSLTCFWRHYQPTRTTHYATPSSNGPLRVSANACSSCCPRKKSAIASHPVPPPHASIAGSPCVNLRRADPQGTVSPTSAANRPGAACNCGQSAPISIGRPRRRYCGCHLVFSTGHTHSSGPRPHRPFATYSRYPHACARTTSRRRLGHTARAIGTPVRSAVRHTQPAEFT